MTAPAMLPPSVAGIDVGGRKKGFHAVVMSNGLVVSKVCKNDAAEVVAWCKELGVAVVAVDAPISWSKTGHARSAERALMRQGIWCFSTPTAKVAKTHPTNHFDWMLQGAKLYRALDNYFTRFDGSNDRVRPICFETFPHAIACVLNGAPVSARSKCKSRRTLLAKSGTCCDSLTNIDFVDAGLCALTAQLFASRRYMHYGESSEGVIVLPAAPPR